VHNIIKHSGADSVEMNIQCGEHLRITITDNGKGIDINKTDNTGNGLKNIYKRIKEIHGEVMMKNDNGLSLTFIIPFNSAV
jgi:two-component system, NarL family, nitrate/nitrite sensor histidine kinase NarQ